MSARTLRQIVGVPASLQAGTTLIAAKTVVVLIDYQNEYRSGPLALPDEPSASKAARQLRAWADQLVGGIETLLIAGYMTHNCVDSTAREAFHRGYRVGVVADASATRDLPGPDGKTIPAATVHAAVLAGLGDRIAEIVDVAMLETMKGG